MTAKIARIYDARASIPYDPNSDSAYMADDVKLVEEVVCVPERLLDAGCGLGWHVDKCLERGFPLVVGLDVSQGSIDAGRARLSRNWSSGWSLVCGDIATHRPQTPYTAVASFLSCVGSFGDAGDLQLVSSLHAMLRSRAALVMTSFYLEGVDALVGEFVTRYSSASPVKLHTSATFDHRTKEVVFRQHIEAGCAGEPQIVEEERIRLYSRDEMRALATAAGFKRVETFPECRLNGAQRSIDRSGVMLTIGFA